MRRTKSALMIRRGWRRWKSKRCPNNNRLRSWKTKSPRSQRGRRGPITGRNGRRPPPRRRHRQRRPSRID